MGNKALGVTAPAFYRVFGKVDQLEAAAQKGGWNSKRTKDTTPQGRIYIWKRESSCICSLLRFFVALLNTLFCFLCSNSARLKEIWKEVFSGREIKWILLKEEMRTSPITRINTVSRKALAPKHRPAAKSPSVNTPCSHPVDIRLTPPPRSTASALAPTLMPTTIASAQGPAVTAGVLPALFSAPTAAPPAKTEPRPLVKAAPVVITALPLPVPTPTPTATASAQSLAVTGRDLSTPPFMHLTTVPTKPESLYSQQKYRRRTTTLVGSGDSDLLTEQWKAFQAAFERTGYMQKRALLMKTAEEIGLPRALVDLILTYESQATPRPRPPSVPIAPLQVLSTNRCHVTGRGATRSTWVALSFQVREDESRKGIPGPPPDLQFIVDKSRSMRGYGEDTIKKSFLALFQKTGGITEGVRVGIFTFDRAHEDPIPGGLLTDALREEIIKRVEDTGPTSMLRGRTGTELLPSLQRALFKAVELGMQNMASGVSRLMQIIICTDGENETVIDERVISSMFDVLWKEVPADIVAGIRIVPIGMGRLISYSQLRALGRGKTDVVKMDKPEQLIAVIQRILLERGVLVISPSVILRAPEGCLIRRVLGYPVPKQGVRSITLLLPSLLDGDKADLFVELSGFPIGGGTLMVQFQGVDQISRGKLEVPNMEVILGEESVDQRTFSMITQWDMYSTALTILSGLSGPLQVAYIEELINQFDASRLSWVVALMQISSVQTIGSDVEAARSEQVLRMIEAEKRQLTQTQKQPAPVVATIQAVESLQAFGLFRWATRNQVTKMFRDDAKLMEFFRPSSCGASYLVFCWRNPIDPNQPHEQLFRVERNADGSARFILDNENMQIKDPKVYVSLDELLKDREAFKAASTASAVF